MYDEGFVVILRMKSDAEPSLCSQTVMIYSHKVLLVAIRCASIQVLERVRAAGTSFEKYFTPFTAFGLHGTSQHVMRNIFFELSP